MQSVTFPRESHAHMSASLELPATIDIDDENKLQAGEKKLRLNFLASSLDKLVDNLIGLGTYLTCPVCRSFLIKPLCMPCLHAICESCAGNLVIDEQGKCPECREFFSKRQLKKYEILDNMLGYYKLSLPKSSSQDTLSQVATYTQLYHAYKLQNPSISPYTSKTPSKVVDTITPPTIKLDEEGNPQGFSVVTPHAMEALPLKTPPTIHLNSQKSPTPLKEISIPVISTASPRKRLGISPPLSSSPKKQIDEEEQEEENRHYDTMNPSYKKPVSAVITSLKTSSKTTKLPPSIFDENLKDKRDPFRVGAIVTVSRRMGPGENRPGGVAKITKKNDDGTVDVHYTVEGRREKRVSLKYISAGLKMDADSMFGKPPSDSNLNSCVATSSKTSSSKNISESSNSNVSSSKLNISTPAPIRKSKSFTSTTRQLSFSSSLDSPQAKPNVIVLTGHFPETTKKRIKSLMTTLNGKLIVDSELENWDSVTHVVALTKSMHEGLVAMKRSLKYFYAISLGLWLVDLQWIYKSHESKFWQNESKYEVVSDITSLEQKLPLNGPQRAREAMNLFKSKGENKLLYADNYVFYFVGEFKLPKKDLILFAVSSGAIVLDDEDDVQELLQSQYDPEDLSTQPQSVGQNKVFVISQDKKFLKLKKFRELKRPAVSVNWFLNCLSSYQVLDIAPYLFKT